MDKLRLLLLIVCSQISGALIVNYLSQLIGTPATLTCTSPHAVDCVWLFNEKSIKIANRYRYLSSDGSNTTKCSLIISLFHEEDVGNWTCWSMSTDVKDGHLLKTYELTTKTKQYEGYMWSTPRNVTATLGDTITLYCSFSINIEQCNWLRNNESILAANRYTYVHTLPSCALRITNLQHIDTGAWQCTTSANNRYGYIYSKISWVRIFGIPLTPPVKSPTTSVVEHPQNVTVMISTTTTLTCKFKDLVKCVWFRKGLFIHVGYRYSYVNGKDGIGTADCSLKIDNVQMIDDGMWHCAAAANDSHSATVSHPAFLTLTYEITHIKITRYSSNIVDRYGGGTSMTCVFSLPVNCVWRRNDKIVMIKNRYKYLNSNGTAARDCSISITAIKDIDIGIWKCEYQSNYSHSAVESIDISLSLFKAPSRPIIKLDGKEVTEVQLPLSSNSSTFICTSSMGRPEPNLQWQIDGINVFSVHFTTTSTSNMYTNATTIITFARILKQTSTPSVLKCIAKHPSFEETLPYAEVIFKKPEEPTIINPPSIIIHPQQVFAQDGENIILECIFDQPVDCYWNYDIGLYFVNVTFIDGRDGKNTTNCSIHLESFNKHLAGVWQCSSVATADFEEVKSKQASLVLMKTPTGPFVKLNYEDVSEVFLDDLDFSRDKLTCHSYRGNPEPDMMVILTSKENEFPITHSWRMMSYSEDSLFDVIIGVTPTTNKTLIDNIFKYDSLICVLSHPTLRTPRFVYVPFTKENSSVPEFEANTTEELVTEPFTAMDPQTTENDTTTTTTTTTTLYPSDTTSALASQNSMHLNTKYAAIGSSLFIFFLIILGLAITLYYRRRRNPSDEHSSNFLSKFFIHRKRSNTNDQLIKYSEHVPENDAENDDAIYF